MSLFSKWTRRNEPLNDKTDRRQSSSSRCKHDKFRSKPVRGAYLLSCDGRVIPLRKENLPPSK